MSSALDPLDPRDLERLLARAEHDPEASAELDLVADLVAAAERERIALAPALSPSLAPASHPSAPLRPLRSWILAAAASVLFVAALALWYLRGERSVAPRLAAGEPPRYLASELRAPDAPVGIGFEAAMESYQRADWPRAARELEACLARAPEHGPAHFYLAAAREQLGELDAAEVHYTRAAAAPDPLLAAHARLRLAELWLARGERERARAELTRLRDEGGELAASAAELLAELDTR